MPRARAGFPSRKLLPLPRTSCPTHDHLLPSSTEQPLPWGRQRHGGKTAAHRETLGREEACMCVFIATSHHRVQTWGILFFAENRGNHTSYLLMVTSLVLRNLRARLGLKGSAPPSLCLFYLCVFLTRMQALTDGSVYTPGRVLGTGVQ